MISQGESRFLFFRGYNAARELLVKDNVIFVEGEIRQDDYSGGLSMRANHVYGLAQHVSAMHRHC